MSARRRRYWYYITVDRCPVCGREQVYRERRYGRRPADYTERYEFNEYYDWCDAL